MLAAGGARRWLAARHVLGELDVHRLVARLELVALEHVRARADVLFDLLVRVGLGDALGHDEGHVGTRLAERLEHETAGLAQEDAEGVGRRRIHALHELHQRRAHRIALAPALQRGDHVLARDRLAVVELQALAQLEGPQPVVAALGPALDHLRLDLGAFVGAEQRVVDHVAVVAAHVGGGPDRIQDRQVGVRHHAQHIGLRLRRAGHQRHRGHGRRRSPAFQRRCHRQDLRFTHLGLPVLSAVNGSRSVPVDPSGFLQGGRKSRATAASDHADANGTNDDRHRTALASACINRVTAPWPAAAQAAGVLPLVAILV